MSRLLNLQLVITCSVEISKDLDPMMPSKLTSSYTDVFKIWKSKSTFFTKQLIKVGKCELVGATK